MNIPITFHGLDKERDSNKGHNVIEKTIEFQKVLADKKRPKDERAEALKCPVQFVGDLRQPLHCGDIAWRAEERKVELTNRLAAALIASDQDELGCAASDRPSDLKPRVDSFL